MKGIKYSASKLKFVLGALLAIIGFCNCDNNSISPEEYGCPSVDLKIGGIVKSEEGAGINGIRVIFDTNTNSTSSYYAPKDTVYTNSKGEYQLAKKFTGLIDFKIVYEDVDGVENGGEFDKYIVDLNKTEFIQTKKGSGAWYRGIFEASKEINLTKK
jgi:putative lipoprotein (rSAM/lipoprotein system)